MQKIILLSLLLSVSIPSFSQKCSLLLNGKLVDANSKEAISFAAILDKGSGQGSVSEFDGSFHFHDRCPGQQQLIISHVGYVSDTLSFVLHSDTTMVVQLQAKAEWLEGVEVIEDYHAHDQRYIGGAIQKKTISLQSNKNLADMLEEVEGVNVLKTGAGISKPIIHGNYGNRVTTINRGITQASQQWGNDHGLEVDAFGASKINVIKGAGVLAYDGNSIGNVIVVESETITPDSSIHGELNSIFQSNGLGFTFNGLLEKTSKWASWRVAGTYKKMGDTHAPDYFLTNTGKDELNVSLQLNKSFFKKWYNELYASTYNTQIGILRGSHVSSLSDLEEAIGRDEPFFTSDYFSYDIQAPRQEVSHNLIKYEAKYFTRPYSYISFKYGWQYDQRNEFDIRRGDRSDIPSLSLTLITNAIQASYVHHFQSGFTLKSGYQYNYMDNTNDPETGIIPLIPDYISWSNSLYALLEKDKSKWGYDIGFRLNRRNFNVVSFTDDLPRQIIRYSNLYSNLAIAGSIRYVWQTGWTAKLNVNFAQRSPDINELYSNGLHQGVAAIEEGNPDLNSENNFKSLISLDWNRNKKWHLQAVGYLQAVDNYIFLEPTGEFRLTIRGAYPVYRYNQAQALIYGGDFTADYQLTKTLELAFAYALVRGDNLSENVTLINIPADRIKLALTYAFKEGEKWGGSSLTLRSSYTLKQWRISEYQDFMPPPDAYFLLGLQATTYRYFKTTQLGFNLRIDNLLNTTYRDYLNRLRYYSDDLGINIQLGLQFSF
jgi:iron complex outermembrane receptor protein